jgi:hypothetical protein
MTAATSGWDARTVTAGATPTAAARALPWAQTAAERRARFAQTLRSMGVEDRLTNE